MDEAQHYLAEAQESLAEAESELAHHRLNNCTRDAYYACFQAAIAALLNEEISPRDPEDLIFDGGITLCKRTSSAN
jgi:uncharacterized protein (UPF0332 family)